MTPAEEQLAKFNAFDVMVTTHGSHMGNMVFTTENSEMKRMTMARPNRSAT